MFKQVTVFAAAMVLSLSSCSQENSAATSRESNSSPEGYSFERTSKNQGILITSLNDFQNVQNEIDAIIQQSGRSASIKAESMDNGILLTMDGNLEGLFEETAYPQAKIAKSVSLTQHDYCIRYALIWDLGATHYKGFKAYTDVKAIAVYTLFLTTPGLEYAFWFRGSCPG